MISHDKVSWEKQTFDGDSIILIWYYGASFISGWVESIPDPLQWLTQSSLPLVETPSLAISQAFPPSPGFLHLQLCPPSKTVFWTIFKLPFIFYLWCLLFYASQDNFWPLFVHSPRLFRVISEQTPCIVLLLSMLLLWNTPSKAMQERKGLF